MSDKVGWFFGPPGTYTESFSPSTHTNTLTHTHTLTKENQAQEGNDLFFFSSCRPILLTFPFSYSFIFCFSPLWKHYLFGGGCWCFLSWCKKRILRPV